MRIGGKMLKEFKKFAMRGNVVDLAVAVIIGGAFGKIVSSLVNDVIMPAIGLLFGGVNFNDLKVVITEAVGDIPEAAIYYGRFIQNIVDFIIIAFVIFLMVKMISKAKKKEEQAPAAPAEEIVLLREIRDALQK